jgi:hypothetical protein
MREVHVPREDLDALAQVPVLFDALVAEGESACTFRKTVTRDDPGIASQRTTPRWPHHLPGELIIALTGQAGVIAMRRQGVVPEGWRGHGVRIRDARFSASVLVGETFLTRVEVGRVRRLGDNVFVSFRFRMWKHDTAGREIEVFRSEQDAMFFPGA